MQPLGIFAVFKVDRIDNRFALGALERLFDHPVIGGIDHQRHFDFLDQLREELGQIFGFVAVGVLEADVHDLRAAPHLQASDFGSFLEFALAD